MNLPLATVLFFSGVVDVALIAGTAYLVFWMGYSGWWWVLSVFLMHGECVATYKIVNALLFGTPLKFGSVP